MHTSLLLSFLIPVIFAAVLFFMWPVDRRWPPTASQRADNSVRLIASTALLAIGIVVMVICYFVFRAGAASDIEVWSGRVQGKERDTVACSHSYQCMCRPETRGSGKDAITVVVCETCYDHNEDYNWIVHSSIGDFTIDRVDRQGVQTPKRWAQIQLGDPVAKTHTYTNYLQLTENSLFNTRKDLVSRYPGKLPQYPTNVYDYYHIDRLVQVGIAIPKPEVWNSQLAVLNGKVGPAKQANVVVVLTNQAEDYADALIQHWDGANKNDIIVMLGLDSLESSPSWVKVHSWSDKKMMAVTMHEELRSLTRIAPDTVLPIVERNVLSLFERKRMRDFEYIQNEFGFPLAGLLTGFAIIMGTTVLIMVVNRRNT